MFAVLNRLDKQNTLIYISIIASCFVVPIAHLVLEVNIEVMECVPSAFNELICLDASSPLFTNKLPARMIKAATE